jgi:hypothetical protein
MNIKIIVDLLISQNLLPPKTNKNYIEKCIIQTAKFFNINIDYIIDIIGQTLILNEQNDLNFIYNDYDINKDDQLSNVIPYQEQEYLKRDFKKILYRRFTKFDVNSYVPSKYRYMPFWKVNSDILYRLSSLENINWTNQTLSYARNDIIGKHIINCIVKPLYNQGLFGKNLVIVDATSSIGADSITFALEKFVSSVISYEILTDVYNMFLNNIKLYGLENKINPKNKKFDYKFLENIPKNFGSLVIIDPPFESPYNVGNFNLSIESTPIYNVAQKCLDIDATAVLITMPKTFKYNKKFALDYNQNVTVYKMGDKNNKIFLIMKLENGEKLKLQNFKVYNIVSFTEKTRQGKINPYICKKI